jgi:DNA-binding MarR family transcriptional regulator
MSVMRRNTRPRPEQAVARGDPASRQFRLEDSPFFLMNRTASAYALAMEQALRRVGADVPRWRVLMLAYERGPISVGSIAENAVIKLSTTTKVVQRLRDEGLVKLRRSRRDARVTEVQITARGLAVVAKVRAVASGIYRRAFADVPAAEVLRFKELLVHLHRNIRAGG